MPKLRDLHGQFERSEEYGRALAAGVVVGVASTPVLRANKHRKQAVFVNDSDTVIYLAKGQLATINAGIRLNAAGGSWVEQCDAMGYLWVGAFSAISTAAAKNLAVTEDV